MSPELVWGLTTFSLACAVLAVCFAASARRSAMRCEQLTSGGKKILLAVEAEVAEPQRTGPHRNCSIDECMVNRSRGSRTICSRGLPEKTYAFPSSSYSPMAGTVRVNDEGAES